MTIELKRSEDDYRAQRAAAVDRELERAGAGLPPPTVSTKAAAKYLDVHVDTLGEWRRRSPPLGPPYQKGAGDVGGGANQHVRYLFDDLVAWRQGRAHTSSKERRLLDELAAWERKRREVELELALQDAKGELARLQKKLGRIAKLETVHDIAVTPHEWALVGGRVAGHVLAVDDTVLASALDQGDVWHATVETALTQAPWTTNEARGPYVDAFEGVLQGVEDALRAARARQRALDLDERWGPGASDGERVRPFERDTRL